MWNSLIRGAPTHIHIIPRVTIRQRRLARPPRASRGKHRRLRANRGKHPLHQPRSREIRQVQNPGRVISDLESKRWGQENGKSDFFFDCMFLTELFGLFVQISEIRVKQSCAFSNLSASIFLPCFRTNWLAFLPAFPTLCSVISL